MFHHERSWDRSRGCEDSVSSSSKDRTRVTRDSSTVQERSKSDFSAQVPCRLDTSPWLMQRGIRCARSWHPRKSAAHRPSRLFDKNLPLCCYLLPLLPKVMTGPAVTGR